jgi:hypothetical protein
MFTTTTAVAVSRDIVHPRHGLEGVLFRPLYTVNITPDNAAMCLFAEEPAYW